MTRRLAILLAIFLLGLWPARPASAVLRVAVGGMTLDFSERANWTLSRLAVGDNVLLGTNTGSSQGTVLAVGGEWAGSLHGNAPLLSAELLVDGEPQPVADGLQYAGQSISLVRTSELRGAYRLTSTLTATSGAIHEQVELVGLATDLAVNCAYGFLGSRDNNLTAYGAYDADGRLIQAGRAEADDDSFVQFGSAPHVIQFDPATGVGLLATLALGVDLNLQSFIWDRPFDNKLYFRLREIEGAVTEGRRFEIAQSLTVLQDLAEPLPDQLATLFAEVPRPLLAGDVDGNGLVDRRDLLLLQSYYGQRGDSPADFNGDGVVNAADFVLLAANFGLNLPAPAVVPEPGTLLLTLTGWLMARATARR